MIGLFEYIKESFNPTFTEVKYFHPSGKSLPNGSHYQRGGFIKECINNKNSFILDEGVHGEQYGLKKYKGGIVVFSTDINAEEMSRNKVINKVKQLVATIGNRANKGKKIHGVINRFNNGSGEYIGAYSVGNFFKGKYVGDNGEMYGEKSLSIEIDGLSSEGLLAFAEMIAKEFRQETVLVKDLNKNKIYLADSIPIPDGKTLDDELNEKIPNQ